MALHLDTHVVVWLAAGEHARIPAEVIAQLNSEDVRHSPQVRLELEYLVHKGAITASPAAVLGALHPIGLREESEVAFGRVVDHATDVAMAAWTHRDPFDRLIVAHARAAGARLVTKDRSIRAHWPPELILWD